MASRLYYRGAKVGDTVIDELIANVTENENEYEPAARSYRNWMIDALTGLDERLWWQPETSEVFYLDENEPSGSDKPLPYADDPDGFDEWWKETTDAWIERGTWVPDETDDEEESK